jgi:hypothetical protein
VETRYECWGPDKEDLTARLRKHYDDGDIPIFFGTGGPPSWKFRLTCLQGHENVFDGTDRP